jgi:hypothetical protein
MAGDGGSLEASNRPKKWAKSTCKRCGLVGHITRRSRSCRHFTKVLSPFHGILPPTADTKIHPTATVATDSKSCQTEIADSANYEQEKQDSEFMCGNKKGDAKHLSIFSY